MEEAKPRVGHAPLVEAEDLGEVGLGELAGGAELFQRHFGDELSGASVDFSLRFRAHFGFEIDPLLVGGRRWIFSIRLRQLFHKGTILRKAWISRSKVHLRSPAGRQD